MFACCVVLFAARVAQVSTNCPNKIKIMIDSTECSKALHFPAPRICGTTLGKPCGKTSARGWDNVEYHPIATLRAPDPSSHSLFSPRVTETATSLSRLSTIVIATADGQSCLTLIPTLFAKASAQFSTRKHRRPKPWTRRALWRVGVYGIPHRLWLVNGH